MMTEEHADMLHEVTDQFYTEFSHLVARNLAKLPDDLRWRALEYFQDKCSVYGSCYDDYLNEYRKIADDPAFK